MFQFEVLQNGPDSESVWLWGLDGREVVLGAVSREAVQDDADLPQAQLSHEERVLLVSGSLDGVADLLRAKIEAGDPIGSGPDGRPVVYIRSGELRRAGVTLRTEILNQSFSWG